MYKVKNKEELKKIIKQASPNDDLNYLDVSAVTNMEGLFRDSSFNGNISKWDVSNVTDMNHMFQRSKFKGDISNWKVNNVKFMVAMFDDSDFFLKTEHLLIEWEVSDETTMMLFGKDWHSDNKKDIVINSVIDFKKQQDIWRRYENLGCLKHLLYLK